ncbi:hypothetical protein [Roseomonas indoligenes]|uniref:Uncharacterized protein n=1 Tax=Roseomonas indoligenes TaxID=2820811 RepID=A0A940MXA2_9PROT|nr:hypothetical protein [Pararoseomonas indoligenes]MBP0492181.1 hypothetical protein [Pararoseomonas indoligenes]
MQDTLSRSEAARRAGISRPALEKHIRAGRIALTATGEVRVASFDLWLNDRQNRDAPATRAPVARESVDGSAAADARDALKLVEAEGVFETRADAERHRDSFIARLRQVEYEREVKAVALIADTAEAVGKEYAAVRSKLLSIPAEHAPRIHRCKTIAEVQAVLTEVVTEALEALTRDVALGAH